MPTPLQPHILIVSSQKTISCAAQQSQESFNSVATQLCQTAHDVYEFFYENFKIDGVNGQRKIPHFIIGWDQENSAWTCSLKGGYRQCFLKFHNDPAIRKEAVAHEYTYAMLSHLTKLGSSGEAGALHESISEVMAIAFKHLKTKGQDWKIADHNLSKHITMKSFKKTPSRSPDMGNVHYNCQIPSHAFYEVVKQVDDVSYGVIVLIWMQAAMEVSPKETFMGFALKTIQKASRLPLKVVMRQSWVNVGVLRFQIQRPPVNTEYRRLPKAPQLMST